MNHAPEQPIKYEQAPLAAPKHGGDLQQASKRYGIALENWLDLSTGINPDAYPIPSIPDSCFHRLPDEHTLQLLEAAKTYYQTQNILPANGSQAFIELLPALRKPCRVAIPHVGYREHAWNWQRHGHELVWYDGFNPSELEHKLNAENIDCAVLISPNNPTAAIMPPNSLIKCQQVIARRDGWLIIDGAFQDTPNLPTDGADHPVHPASWPGVIELRSLGKFFGLAGIRLGFALADQGLIERLLPHIGLWSVSSVSQFVATTALKDKPWQAHTRLTLPKNSTWMFRILRAYYKDENLFKTPFFISVLLPLETAIYEHDRLAKQGVWTRLWPIPQGGRALLRFGLISQMNLSGRSQFSNLHKSPY